MVVHRFYVVQRIVNMSIVLFVIICQFRFCLSFGTRLLRFHLVVMNHDNQVKQCMPLFIMNHDEQRHTCSVYQALRTKGSSRLNYYQYKHVIRDLSFCFDGHMQVLENNHFNHCGLHSRDFKQVYKFCILSVLPCI